MRFQNVSNKEVKAYNVYESEKESLPLGIIREHFATRKLQFSTLFDYVLPNGNQVLEIGKFMVEHDNEENAELTATEKRGVKWVQSEKPSKD